MSTTTCGLIVVMRLVISANEERLPIATATPAVFATGKQDVLPAIDGLQAVYGRSAFVCPYCDGWELRDRPLVLIAQGERLIHMATTLRGWSDHLTVCSNGPAEITADQARQFAQNNVALYEGEIAAIDSLDGQVRAVRLKDGTRVNCTGLFVALADVQSTGLPEKLGCRMTPSGSVHVDNPGETSVPGVYVAGDAGREGYQLIIAASDGSIAAIAINGELLHEDWLTR